MSTLELRVNELTKTFDSRDVFHGVSFHLTGGDALAVTGRNGSGKSTFLKILANVMEPTSGRVEWLRDTVPMDAAGLPAAIGFVAPYLALYTEFTAWEHVAMIQDLRGMAFDEAATMGLFERFGLADRRHDRLATYSSGMMQRAKFICALVHRPSFLLLDEPMNTLDTDGIDAMRRLVLDGREQRITIVATNEDEDLSLCTKRLSFEETLAVS